MKCGFKAQKTAAFEGLCQVDLEEEKEAAKHKKQIGRRVFQTENFASMQKNTQRNNYLIKSGDAGKTLWGILPSRRWGGTCP